MMNTCRSRDQQLNPEAEIVPRLRRWFEVKLCEVLHGSRTDPFIAAPLVVVTMRRTHKSK
jgi:late competence protein required for DNA uptake (superfamily II DNA/RNA helicase)